MLTQREHHCPLLLRSILSVYYLINQRLFEVLFYVTAVGASDVYLLQLLLCGEAQAVDSVGPAVCPLSKLLGGFGEGHVGGDGAVDDSLTQQRRIVEIKCE